MSDPRLERLGSIPPRAWADWLGAGDSRRLPEMAAAVGATSRDRVLVIGCGAGEGVDALARCGYRRLVGVEEDASLALHAHGRLQAEGHDARVVAGTFEFASRELHGFSVVLIPDAPRLGERRLGAALALAATAVRPGGSVALPTTPLPTSASLSDRCALAVTVRGDLCESRVLDASGRVLLLGVEPLIAAATIAAFLDDLPLAARRVLHGPAGEPLLVARCDEPIAPAAATEPTSRVAVILGDPRRPDSVKHEGRFNPHDFETVNRMKAALGSLRERSFDFIDDHAELLAGLAASRPELVLNLCDEGFLNDAFLELHLPAFMESLAIPYTGAGPACLGACYDKAAVRAIARSSGIPVPREVLLPPGATHAAAPAPFPLIVKPNFGDSSFGISARCVVRDADGLARALESLRASAPGRPVLVQEFLGGEEFSIGLVGNPGAGLVALPVLQVDYSGLPDGLPRLLGRESKWDPSSVYWRDLRYRPASPAGWGAEWARMHEWSALLFERLGCRDYARFDYRAGEHGVVRLLEVNPNPSWAFDGKMALMAGFAGLSYAGFLGMVLSAAERRLRG